MLKLHLQFFAEGGGEAAGSEGTAAEGGFDAEFQRQFGYRPERAAPEEAQEKPEPAEKDEPAQEKPDQKTEEAGGEDPDKAFEGLIKGKYKDQFGKRVQGIINDRFKNHSAELNKAQQELQAYKDAIDPYLEKLGVDRDDVEAIQKAALEDRSNFRSTAVANNQTVEEAMLAYQKAREEALKQRKADAQAQAVENAQATAAEEQRQREIYEDLKRQEAELQKKVPGFNLAKEISENESFRKALDAGLGVEFAYRGAHFDEVMAQTAGAVERQTAINTAQQIAANRNRPREGGLGSSPASSAKTDFGKMDDQEFLKLFNKTLR